MSSEDEARITLARLEADIARLRAEALKSVQDGSAIMEAHVDTKIAEVKLKVWGVFTVLLVLASIGAVLGVPQYFEARVTDAGKDAIDAFNQASRSSLAACEATVKQLSSDSSMCTRLAQAATRHSVILLASDLAPDNPYVEAMLARLMPRSTETSVCATYVQLSPPIEAAAAKLQFVAHSLPSAAIVAVVYNPSEKSKDLIVGRLKASQNLYVGYKNGLSDALFQAEGGLEDCHFLRKIPDEVDLPQDVSMKGLRWIAPAASFLACSDRTEPDLLAKLGEDCDYHLDHELPPVTEGRVVYVDDHGNCLTSIKTAEVAKLLGDTRQPIYLYCDKASTPIVVHLRKGLLEADRGDILGIDCDGWLNLLIKDGSFARDNDVSEASRVRVSQTGSLGG